MPFQFAPYDNRASVGQLVELMLRGTQARSDAIQAGGNAQARAAEVGGQAWGQAANQIGQTIGSLPAQMQQAKAQQQDQQLRAGQIKLQGTQQAGADLSLDAAQQGKRYHDDLADILKRTPQQTEGGVSVYNLPAIEQQLAQRGHGQFAADTVKSLGGLNDAFRQEAAAKQALVQRGAQEVQRAGNSPVLAGLFLDQLEKNGSYPKEIIAQYREFIAADPGNVAKMTAALAGPVKLESVAAGGSLVNPNTAQPAFTAPDKPMTVPAGSSLVQPPSQPGGQATSLYTAPAKESLQSKSVLLDGKPAELSFNPDGGAWLLNGQPVDPSRVKPIPPASVTVNAAREAAIAQGLPDWALDASRPVGPEANVADKRIGYTPNALYQATLTYINTGQFPQTGRTGDPTTQLKRDAVMNKAGAIAAAAGMDVPTLRAFYKSNAGSLGAVQKMADAVQSFMATADRNVEAMKPYLAKIGDTGSPLFNQPLRTFQQKVAGDENMARVGTYLQSVQNEYARIISQPNLSGQLSDSARHEAEQLLAPTATVAQMLASLEALRTEGSNRMLSLGEQIGRISGRMQAPGGNGNAAPQPGQPIQVGGFTVKVK